MSRRILGMRTTNWTSLSTSRPSRTSTRLDRGEYEWDVVIMDANDRPGKRLTIRADSFDDAVTKSLSLVKIGQAVTVDGRRFTK
jgi:hypothetical protein